MSEQSGAQAMQFGIMSVSDITRDPTTGVTPSEQERIKATLAIARHSEEVGLDVFAIGEHHNRRSGRPAPRRSSPHSPRRPSV